MTDKVEVTYSDGSSAELSLPVESWGEPGSDKFIEQVAGDDPKAQALMRDTMNFLRRGRYYD